MSATVSLYVPNNEIKWVAGPFWNIKPSERTRDLDIKSTEVYKEITNEADSKFGVEWSDEKGLWIDQEAFERDPLDFGHWSDWGKHEDLTIYKCNKRTEHTRNKRYGKYMKKIKELFPEYIRQDKGKYNTEKYIILDEIGYRQGWWFTKELFKRKESIFMAFTKADAYKLMDKLFNKGYKQDIPVGDGYRDDKYVINKTETSAEYLRGLEAYDYFHELLDKMEDNTFIFEVAW